MTRLQEIKRGLRVAAYLVVRHGDAYAPLLDRLETELATRKNRFWGPGNVMTIG